MSTTRAGSSPLARGLPPGRSDRQVPRRIIPARAGFTRHGRAGDQSRGDHPRSRGVYLTFEGYILDVEGSSPLARGLRGRGRRGPPTGRIIPARAGFTDGAGVSAGAWPGSSPLARGLLVVLGPRVSKPGIIPARAGFTPVEASTHPHAGDHPRSRGVYATSSTAAAATPGSSPLARGLQRLRAVGVPAGRIIPARAGFTMSDIIRERSPRDHPRSRGVYLQAGSARITGEGSSPLARGLRRSSRRPGRDSGIIPARAGFTEEVDRQARQFADHPRSRGVYIRPATDRPSGVGSSPLARGLRLGGAVGEGRRRIIPARAGFTCGDPPPGCSRRDHPRSRGVYATDAAHLVGQAGSSPLARGLHRRGAPDGEDQGIIPARAGFTYGPGNEPGPSWDHPRSRGVYPSEDRRGRRVRGSSPLARGLRSPTRGAEDAGGIIPARAGFTRPASSSPIP